MPIFYYYTDDEGSKNIIRSGKILASLTFSGTDAAYGNGVYLTKLSPETSSKNKIAMNNWLNTRDDTMRKMKNYFILNIPKKDIKNVNETGRNVFMFGYGNDLQLHKYPWVLKGYDTEHTIASYKYQGTSSGRGFFRH